MFSIEKQSIAFNKLPTNWEKPFSFFSALVSVECQLSEGKGPRLKGHKHDQMREGVFF